MALFHTTINSVHGVRHVGAQSPMNFRRICFSLLGTSGLAILSKGISAFGVGAMIAAAMAR
jgi:hypothetical protein